MTRKPVLTACIAFSLFAHFLLIHMSGPSASVRDANQILVPADFDVTALSSVEPLGLGHTVEQGAGHDNGEKTTRTNADRLSANTSPACARPSNSANSNHAARAWKT